MSNGAHGYSCLVLACLILENDNAPNGIVLDPFEGDPIVGEVLEREGARSGRWRFIEVEWLD